MLSQNYYLRPTLFFMRVNSIQFLRAVAALLVVYEHSMDIQTEFGISWQQKLFHLKYFGCIGVDLFFVISGFIITYVANKYNGLDEGVHFLKKRFFRINPVYYIATFIFLGVYLLQMYMYAPLRSFFYDTTNSLIDSALIIPLSGDIKFYAPLLIVGWTLSFEWLFYLLFFIFIAGNVKRKTLFLSSLILLLIILGLLVQSSDLRLNFITNPIMLEFVSGVLICQVYLSHKKMPVTIGILLLSFGVISYLILIRLGYGTVWNYLETISGKSSLARFLLWGIPSSSLVIGCVLLEKNAKLHKLWSNKWVLLAGDASYSIYLIHWPVLILLMMLYRKIGFFLPVDIMIWLQVIIAVFISIAFYKLIEKPLLKNLKNATLWNKSTPDKNRIYRDETKLMDKIETVVN